MNKTEMLANSEVVNNGKRLYNKAFEDLDAQLTAYLRKKVSKNPKTNKIPVKLEKVDEEKIKNNHRPTNFQKTIGLPKDQLKPPIKTDVTKFNIDREGKRISTSEKEKKINSTKAFPSMARNERIGNDKSFTRSIKEEDSRNHIFNSAKKPLNALDQRFKTEGRKLHKIPEVSGYQSKSEQNDRHFPKILDKSSSNDSKQQKGVTRKKVIALEKQTGKDQKRCTVNSDTIGNRGHSNGKEGVRIAEERQKTIIPQVSEIAPVRNHQQCTNNSTMAHIEQKPMIEAKPNPAPVIQNNSSFAETKAIASPTRLPNSSDVRRSNSGSQTHHYSNESDSSSESDSSTDSDSSSGSSSSSASSSSSSSDESSSSSESDTEESSSESESDTETSKPCQRENNRSLEVTTTNEPQPKRTECCSTGSLQLNDESKVLEQESQPFSSTSNSSAITNWQPSEEPDVKAASLLKTPKDIATHYFGLDDLSDISDTPLESDNEDEPGPRKGSTCKSAQDLKEANQHNEPSGNRVDVENYLGIPSQKIGENNGTDHTPLKEQVVPNLNKPSNSCSAESELDSSFFDEIFAGFLNVPKCLSPIKDEVLPNEPEVMQIQSGLESKAFGMSQMGSVNTSSQQSEMDFNKAHWNIFIQNCISEKIRTKHEGNKGSFGSSLSSTSQSASLKLKFKREKDRWSVSYSEDANSEPGRSLKDVRESGNGCSSNELSTENVLPTFYFRGKAVQENEKEFTPKLPVDDVTKEKVHLINKVYLNRALKQNGNVKLRT